MDVDEESRRRRLVEGHVRFGKSPDEACAWVESVDEVNARRIAAHRQRADLVIQSDQIDVPAQSVGTGGAHR